MDRGFKVLAITPDVPFLVKNTPAEGWLEELKSGRKDPGYIPLFNNLSNLVRLAMLYKYEGVYLDTDFIILKDFSELRNAVGAQSMDTSTGAWTRLNGAAMIFDINHPILLDFLREFATTFNGNRWGFNRAVLGFEGYLESGKYAGIQHNGAAAQVVLCGGLEWDKQAV